MHAAAWKRKSLSIGLSLGLLGLLYFAFRYRRELQLEWWRRRASQDCLQAGFDRTAPTPAWHELLKAGEPGFPHLSRLLRQPEYEVWKMAVDLADHEMAEDLRSRFVEHLRKRDPCASILYLIAPRDQRALDSHRADWREGGDGFGRRYWTGSDETALAPFPEAIEFLKEVLAEVPGPGEAWVDSCDFKHRAIHALAAMEEAREVTGLLVWTALRDQDPEVRLRAIQALVFRSGETSGGTSPELTDWEAFSLDGSTPNLMPRVFLDRGVLRALVHLDHPRVLLVLARLHGMAQVRPLLEEVLSRDQRFWLPLPRWLPLRDSCKRFLMGPPLERVLAMLALAELPAGEGRAVLESALAAEADPEMRLLARACLLSLGDESQREEVRTAFEKRMRVAGRASPPPGVLLLRGMYHRWDQLLRSVANGFRVDGWDLGVLLARSGDRDALEHIVLSYSNYSAAQGYINLSPDSSSFLEGTPSYRHGQLRDWWESFKDRIRWDPDRRRFLVAEEPGRAGR